MEFTLTIHAARTGRLTGVIDGRFDSAETAPANNFAVRMPARGHVAGRAVRFAATHIARRRGVQGHYALDDFSGNLDADGVLRAVNNDGTYVVDRPYRFERTSCSTKRPRSSIVS